MGCSKRKYRGINILLFLGVSFAFISCEKDISVEFPEAEVQYVVEGYVEEGQFPYLTISKTVPYVNSNGQTTLSKVKVANPVVMISNGDVTDTITELDSPNGLVYISTKMKGVAGKYYSLKIILPGNKILTSQTYVPVAIALDTVQFLYVNGVDSSCYIQASLTDPANEANYYRVFSKNKQPFFGAGSSSVLHDKFFNGITYKFTIDNGRVTSDIYNDDDRVYTIGDSVQIKFCTITRAGYEFWKEAESQTASNGSPFNSPATLPSNINGGIGIFEGYSSTYYTVAVNAP